MSEKQRRFEFSSEIYGEYHRSTFQTTQNKIL